MTIHDLRPTVHLTEAPVLRIPPPWCGNCKVPVGSDSDGNWLCHKCGTIWEPDTESGRAGQLYQDWSGEDIVDIADLEAGQRQHQGSPS